MANSPEDNELVGLQPPTPPEIPPTLTDEEAIIAGVEPYYEAATPEAPTIPEPEPDTSLRAAIAARRARREAWVRRAPGESGKNLENHPILTRDQERELAQAIEAGREAKAKLDDPEAGLTPDQKEQLTGVCKDGENAKHRFIADNLRLVLSIARNYTSPEHNLDFEDLFQAGTLGLEHAVEKFDYRKGFKLSTYAPWWIKLNIKYAINAGAGQFKIPQHMADQLDQARRADTETEETQRVRDLMGTKELDRPAGEKGEHTIGELLPADKPSPDEQAIDEVQNRRIRGILAEALDLESREALGLRYGFVPIGAHPNDKDPQSYKDLLRPFTITGKELGVDQIKARYIATRAERILRQHKGLSEIANQDPRGEPTTRLSDKKKPEA